METQKVWLEITIAGFVYLAAAFFAILYIAGIHDLSFLVAVEHLLPYISLIVIASSYACGYSIDVLSHPFIAWVTRAPQTNVDDEVRQLRSEAELLLRRKKAAYATLLLFRHLTASSIFLSLSIGCWFSGANISLCWVLVVISFSILFALAYLVQRRYYLNLEQAMRRPRRTAARA